jgi:hypothetical protein
MGVKVIFFLFSRSMQNGNDPRLQIKFVIDPVFERFG